MNDLLGCADFIMQNGCFSRQFDTELKNIDLFPHLFLCMSELSNQVYLELLSSSDYPFFVNPKTM